MKNTFAVCRVNCIGIDMQLAVHATMTPQQQVAVSECTSTLHSALKVAATSQAQSLTMKSPLCEDCADHTVTAVVQLHTMLVAASMPLSYCCAVAERMP
jgi:hypothetical protein